MKNIVSILKYAPKKTAVSLAVLATAIIVPASVFAWGPSRTTYTTANPADKITFNSITDNPAHGDERNFAQVRESTAANSTYADSIDVVPGKTYTVFVYYHNNAAANLNLVATNSYVKMALPAVVTTGAGGTKAVAYVGASNASPTEVWDDVTFVNKTSGDIALRYVDGSAVISNFGATNNSKLSDSIITSGATIGYNALDGNIPGCNEYAGYVTFNVTADQPNFTVDKQVRKSGTSVWLETVSVVTGDSVDYLITYKNNGTTTQNDVVIKDFLPTGVTFTAGTTYVVNTANPGGLKVSDNIVSASGINIGNYATGAAAYVKFSAKVTATTSSLIKCGVNELLNTAKVETNNGSKTDTAIVTMSKVCTTTTELPKTGIGEDIAAILGIGSLVTSAVYYLSSRKFNQ